MGDEPELLGREELIGRCRVGLADGGGVLLTGPDGIGKSAVLDAVAAEAAREGALVLRSRPSSAEASLPFVALYDLFDAVLADAARELVAPHLRAALDVALLRTPSRTPPDRLAVRVAVLELLRALAAHRDVLLTLDDAQCLDPDSAGVIGFAARRLHGHRVAIAVAERIEDGGEPGCLDLLPAARTELPVGPLPGPVIGELLCTRLGLAAGDRLSRRIQAAAGGNPSYALELAAAARRACAPVHPDDPLPVPARLRAPLADRLAALPPASADALLLIAAATPPYPPPPGAAAGGPAAALAAVERPPCGELTGGPAAAVAGRVLIRGPGGELRFAHPLLREIVYADAGPRQRRACHARLAECLDDPLERARHRALATPHPDAAVAAELDRAADLAVGRGAPALAAELARLAAERTPADLALAAERLLACARHAYDAGLTEQAADACAAVLRTAPPTSADARPPRDRTGAAPGTPARPSAEAAGTLAEPPTRPPTPTDAPTRPTTTPETPALTAQPRERSDAAPSIATPPPRGRFGVGAGSPRGGNAARVGARLLLVEMAGGDRAGAAGLLDAAEADAGDAAGLRAAVLLCRADHELSSGRMGHGLAVLAEAERQAGLGGDVDQQMEVVALRASVEMQFRPERVLPSLRRAAALAARRPGGPTVTTASVQVRCCEAVWLLRGGDVPAALAAVNALRADVERAGLVKDLARVLHVVASVHERAGLCAAAHRAALLGGRMLRDLHTASGPGLMLSAAAELTGGTPERAGDLADAAIRAAGQAGDTECTAIAQGLRGRADVLLGHTADAADALGRCRALLRGLGIVDPAHFLVDADLAEALARTGRAGEARLLLAEAAAEAERLGRTVVTLGLARAKAVLDAADGDARGAADRLRAALAPGHPYPLEAARARLTLGELERRARRRAAARTELAAAVRAFAAAECGPWLAFARERLAGLDEPGAVSDADRRIVELVRSGATNRQIAASLHVSVKSVEASLTRLYRRFGVHGRAELTARHAAGLGA